MILTISLTAMNGRDAHRSFDVLDFHFNTHTRHLTLHCRDGRICLELIGEWHVDVRPSPMLARANSVEEAERIHDGKTTVVLSTN